LPKIKTVYYAYFVVFIKYADYSVKYI